VPCEGLLHDRPPTNDRTRPRLRRPCSARRVLGRRPRLAIVGEAGNYVALVPNGRPGPKLLLQRVEETKRVKNRMHIDIETPDIGSEAARLEAHGATRVQPDTRSEHGSTWILMADPDGNEFCVCDAGAEPGDPW
jgi:hypothetical protein